MWLTKDSQISRLVWPNWLNIIGNIVINACLVATLRERKYHEPDEEDRHA
jgi:hypothetical protein